jgi:hypothetical protein
MRRSIITASLAVVWVGMHFIILATSIGLVLAKRILAWTGESLTLVSVWALYKELLLVHLPLYLLFGVLFWGHRSPGIRLRNTLIFALGGIAGWYSGWLILYVLPPPVWDMLGFALLMVGIGAYELGVLRLTQNEYSVKKGSRWFGIPAVSAITAFLGMYGIATLLFREWIVIIPGLVYGCR